MKKRADSALVDSGLASSRTRASQLIKEGVVFADDIQIKKPSQLINTELLEVRKDIQFVSRGAYKLEGAVKEFNIDLQGKTAADIGASTGGFTDYMLQNGVVSVVTIDVGHDQLDKKLLSDERIINFEGINIREGFELETSVDLAVADLSYISLRLVLENIIKLVRDGGEIIILFKPQFEAGKENIGKGGIVKDDTILFNCLNEFILWLNEKNILFEGLINSPITGKNGNREFLFYFIKGKSGTNSLLNGLNEI